MKKIKLILLSLTIATTLIFICVNECQNASIAQKLKNIPQDDRQYLDHFFRFEFSSLGYSLFGNKPVAVLGYCDPLAEIKTIDDMFDRVFCTFDPINLGKYRGWEVWKKYQHLFPMKNYAFIESKNFVENNYKAVIFINKKTFLKTVRKYLNDFKEVLGNSVTPERLLEETLKSKDVFGDVFKHHQGLIGTVLGYGKHNAWLFHRREEISSLSGEISPLLKKSSILVKRRSKPLLQEELDSLNQKLQGFDDRGVLDFNPLFMSMPGFAADPNADETKQLKKEYEQQYRQIIHRYQKSNFLEITIKQMTLKNTP